MNFKWLLTHLSEIHFPQKGFGKYSLNVSAHSSKFCSETLHNLKMSQTLRALDMSSCPDTKMPQWSDTNFEESTYVFLEVNFAFREW